MSPHDSTDAVPGHDRRSEKPVNAIPRLVSQVYETAPAAERSRLLEHLLRPLGVLSLVAVANGVFAKILFQSRGQDLHVRLEDVQKVRASDVIALVDYVQQASVETVYGLAQMVAASPAMAGSAAAALLIAALVQHARSRRAGAGKTDDPSVSGP
jgi:hypothetical protein